MDGFIKIDHNYDVIDKRRETYKIQLDANEMHKYERTSHWGHGGEFKGFTNYIVEILDEFKLPNHAYYSSVLFELGGKSYTIFQHKKENQKHNWFYFSDIFKARNFKSFLLKLKAWFKKHFAEKVEAVFKKVFDKIFKKTEKWIEEVKQITGVKNENYKFRYTKEDGTVFIHFFGLFDLTFEVNGNSITFNVAKEIFEKCTDEFRKLIFEITNFIKVLIYRHHKTGLLVIRKRPAWLISKL